MKQFFIALVITMGLAFAPLADAMCKDPDCAQELIKVEKKETQSKALHVCGHHHHSTNSIQLPSSDVIAFIIEQKTLILAPDRHMTSAIVSPLLEPPSHA